MPPWSTLSGMTMVRPDPLTGAICPAASAWLSVRGAVRGAGAVVGIRPAGSAWAGSVADRGASANLYSRKLSR